MRRAPSARSLTRPASLRTFRCWETAGRVTGRPRANAATGCGPRRKRSKIARRVGSARAAMASVAVERRALAMAYRKQRLTQCQAMLGGLHARPDVERPAALQERLEARENARPTLGDALQHLRARLQAVMDD